MALFAESGQRALTLRPFLRFLSTVPASPSAHSLECAGFIGPKLVINRTTIISGHTNLAKAVSNPYLTQCFFDPQDSPCQTGRRSVQPFLYNRPRDRLTKPRSSIAIVRISCIRCGLIIIKLVKVVLSSFFSGAMFV